MNESSCMMTNQRAIPRDAVELQKLLIDERMRCETHKTNYQTLKEEHTRLQEQNIKIDNELTELHQMKEATEDQNFQKNEIIDALNNRLDCKDQELKVIRTQIVDPAKLEALKGEISRELEEPIKQHMISMDKEVEKYRTDYNKMRYQYTILKTEFEHVEEKKQRALDEQSLRFKTEISALKYERDELLDSLNCKPKTDENELLQLKKMKTHLEQRCNVLEDELNEERKSKEYISREASATQKTLAQDLIKIETNIKTLETEKRSIEIQGERHKKDLKEANDRISNLCHELQDACKDSSNLKSELEECQHRRKLTESEHKVELLKVKGELQREKDSLNSKLKVLETELELAAGAAEQHEKEIQSLEAQTASRIQEELKCEWNRNTLLNSEKAVVEQKLRELEQRYSEERDCAREQKEKFQEEIKNYENSICGLEKETTKLRGKLHESEVASSQYKRELDDMGAVREKLLAREMDINQLQCAKRSIMEEHEKSKCDLQRMRSELEELVLKIERERCDAKRVIEQQTEETLTEKHRMQSRMDELEYKIKKRDECNENLRQQHKKVKAACLKKLRGLNNELELICAQKEKLEVELKAGSYGVSNQEHNRVKRKMCEMEKRLREFQRCLTADQGQLNAPKSQQSFSPSLGSSS